MVSQEDLTNAPSVTADYIVVGAGSAGCALAARLSEDPASKVVLLEAGGKDTNPWIHVPVGYFKTMHNPSVDWCYQTEPDNGLNGRSIAWPRGKVLGGSSSLNGLLYVRGQKEDYDGWAQMGCTDWSYDDVLPFFKRAENQERGANAFHGSEGPLRVSDMRLKRPVCDAWLEAARAAGHPYNADYNAESQEGVSYFQLTAHKGRRCSSATAYLNPAKGRANLKIITRAATRRICFDGKRAIGVIYRDMSGKDHFAMARKEVIVSAGTIGSPQLLMVSGIGPASHLREHGIDPVVDAPSVGSNLQDHLQARLVYKCNEPTLNDEVRSYFNQMRIGLQYILTRTGPMTMAASLAVGFCKTKSDLASPDIQFHFQPWSADSPGEGVHPFSAFTISICLLRPESTGTIRLKSADPQTYPEITANYLATKSDQDTIVAGVRLAQEISRHEPLASKISESFQPAGSGHSDAELLDWVRDTSTTIYHPTGTCRMGTDKDAVLDPKLRVNGVTGLRVADCSIMPKIVSGNTNAPAIMIGEKAADLIRDTRVAA